MRGLVINFGRGPAAQVLQPPPLRRCQYGPLPALRDMRTRAPPIRLIHKCPHSQPCHAHTALHTIPLVTGSQQSPSTSGYSCSQAPHVACCTPTMLNGIQHA